MLKKNVSVIVSKKNASGILRKKICPFVIPDGNSSLFIVIVLDGLKYLLVDYACFDKRPY